MHKRYFIPLICVISLLSSGYTASSTYCPIDPNRPHIAGEETVLNSYLEAVDRGELLTYGHQLGRSEIVPVRIEYIYDIATKTMEITVYSNLKKPISVPGEKGAKVLGVRSIIDDGRIVETESHVWFE